MKTNIYTVEPIANGQWAVMARIFPARKAGEFGNSQDYPEQRAEIRRFATKGDAIEFATMGNGAK